MAARRMLSTDILRSDAYLEMPASARELYTQLMVETDDDGFVGNPKSIMRLVGASEDDLRILIAKSFVFTFDSGVIVVKHFRMQNTLKNDRYRATQYQLELSQLRLTEGKSYERFDPAHDPLLDPEMMRFDPAKIVENTCMIPYWNQSGSMTEPQHNRTQHNITKQERDIAQNLFLNFWQEYPRKVSKKKAFDSWLRVRPDEALCLLIVEAVKAHAKTEQWQDAKYIPHPATWLNQRRWEDELPVQATGKSGASRSLEEYKRRLESGENDKV